VLVCYIYLSQHPGVNHSIDHEPTELGFRPEVTTEGIRVVEDVLRAWTSMTSNQDGDDIVMTDLLSPDVQLEDLKKCIQDFRPEIENNPWLKSLISAL
jgi:DNA mismatch repair protein MSH2